MTEPAELLSDIEIIGNLYRQIKRPTPPIDLQPMIEPAPVVCEYKRTPPPPPPVIEPKRQRWLDDEDNRDCLRFTLQALCLAVMGLIFYIALTAAELGR